MSQHPLFFLHLPRTAGTTIDEIFSANLSADSILKIYSRDEYRKYGTVDADALDKIKYITGHLLLDSTDPPLFYGRPVRAFTLLRHPVKRLFSEYHFLKTWKSQHLYAYLNENNISFSEYITSEAPLLRYRGKNFMTRCISGESLEQAADLDACLEKAKHNLLNNFWFYGIQERFMESLLLLGEKAGLKNLMHQKHNSLTTVNSTISDAELELVQEYNSADLRLYEYAIEKFDDNIKQLGEPFQKKLNNFLFLNGKYQRLASLLYNSAYASQSPERIDLPKDIIW